MTAPGQFLIPCAVAITHTSVPVLSCRAPSWHHWFVSSPTPLIQYTHPCNTHLHALLYYVPIFSSKPLLSTHTCRCIPSFQTSLSLLWSNLRWMAHIYIFISDFFVIVMVFSTLASCSHVNQTTFQTLTQPYFFVFYNMMSVLTTPHLSWTFSIGSTV